MTSVPTKVVIGEVVLDGNKRTKLEFFQNILQEHAIATVTQKELTSLPSLSAGSNSKPLGNNGLSFDELKEALHGVDRELRESRLFDDVDVEAHSMGETNGIQKLSVKINVKEKQILHFGVQTFAETNNNVGAQVYGGFRNPLGHGEQLLFSAKTNQQLEKHQDYMIQASFPFVGHRLGSMVISARKSRDRQSSYFSSYDQDFFTLFSELTSLNHRHRLTAEVSHREEIPFTITPSTEDETTSKENSSTGNAKKLVTQTLQVVQRTCGMEETRIPSSLITHAVKPSWKTSLKYWYQALDTRDSTVNPTSGQLLEGSLEIAVPPGHAQFAKAEVTSQWHLALTKRIWQKIGQGDYSGVTNQFLDKNTNIQTDDNKNALVLSLAASMGIMYPLNHVFASLQNTNTAHNTAAPKKSFLSDRYHMGGPMNLRGFRQAGIGPRAFSTVSDDSIGGDTKRNFLVMLSYPVLNLFPGTSTSNTITNNSCNSSLVSTLTCPVQNVTRIFHQLAQGTDMRVFVFAHAGSIGSPSYWLQVLNQTKSTNTHNNNNNNLDNNTNAVHPMFGFIRMSVGGGMSMIVANTLRLEATYAVPVVYGLHTDHVKAFQLGLGLSIN